MLTDKALEYFENFFLERQKKFDFYNANNFALNEFVTFHSYIDFFDSVGIYVISFRDSDHKENKWTWLVDEIYTFEYFDSRRESDVKAIYQANKIYNLKQNSNSQQH